ncbi:hypothetical protein H9W95_10120 [Flavobacterium lindanitolerans]|nr:hypothetical protein [Flavobacterium lindanitolerans]
MGCWLIIIFLVPVTFIMHDFWTVSDPMLHQLVLMTFMKNMSIIGAALMLAYFGAGLIVLMHCGMRKKRLKRTL